MSTILLASNGGFVTDIAPEILPQLFKNMKMAYVTTAVKKVPSKDYYEHRIKRMNELDIDYEEIDVSGKSAEQLRKRFKDKSVIYVEGGNSFWLLKGIRNSGFEEVVKDLIEKGVTYIGSSAGSYIATPSIVTATWKDPHKFDRGGIKDFSAMNLVPFLTFVHYLPEHKELLKNKTKDINYPVRVLADGQGLLVHDGEVELLGKGKEIIVQTL